MPPVPPAARLTPPWPLRACPRCSGTVAAQPQIDGAWTLVCVHCTREWYEWAPGDPAWLPTAPLQRLVAAGSLPDPAPASRPGAPPPPTGDAGRREAAPC